MPPIELKGEIETKASNPLIDRDMFCPACRTKLVKGEVKKYETLDDHIACTEPMPRTTLVCSNGQCGAHQDQVFWADDGEGPYNTQFSNQYNWIDRNSVPFGSFHRAIHFQCSYHAEDKDFRTRWIMIRREVKYDSNEYGDKAGKQVKYSIWIKHKNSLGFVYWIPGIKMFLYELQCFYQNRKLHLEGTPWKSVDGSSYWSQRIRDFLKRADWPRAEWWRKLSRWYCWTFHRQFLLQIGVKS